MMSCSTRAPRSLFVLLYELIAGLLYVAGVRGCLDFTIVEKVFSKSIFMAGIPFDLAVL